MTLLLIAVEDSNVSITFANYKYISINRNVEAERMSYAFCPSNSRQSGILHYLPLCMKYSFSIDVGGESQSKLFK